MRSFGSSIGGGGEGSGRAFLWPFDWGGGSSFGPMMEGGGKVRKERGRSFGPSIVGEGGNEREGVPLNF